MADLESDYKKLIDEYVLLVRDEMRLEQQCRHYPDDEALFAQYVATSNTSGRMKEKMKELSDKIQELRERITLT